MFAVLPLSNANSIGVVWFNVTPAYKELQIGDGGMAPLEHAAAAPLHDKPAAEHVESHVCRVAYHVVVALAGAGAAEAGSGDALDAMLLRPVTETGPRFACDARTISFPTPEMTWATDESAYSASFSTLLFVMKREAFL